jgi:hypothetical protein
MIRRALEVLAIPFMIIFMVSTILFMLPISVYKYIVYGKEF